MIRFRNWTTSHRRISSSNRPFYFLKRGLDRASKSVIFVKENKSMTPVLGKNIACCGKTLLRISKHFSEVIVDKFAQCELAMVQFIQRQVLLVFREFKSFQSCCERQ